MSELMARYTPSPGGGRLPKGGAGPLFFGKYAILIQMLSYTAWPLCKPLPELWGTLAWGLATGATAYAVRSIWPVVLSHWLRFLRSNQHLLPSHRVCLFSSNPTRQGNPHEIEEPDQ